MAKKQTDEPEVTGLDAPETQGGAPSRVPVKVRFVYAPDWAGNHESVMVGPRAPWSFDAQPDGLTFTPTAPLAHAGGKRQAYFVPWAQIRCVELEEVA